MLLTNSTKIISGTDKHTTKRYKMCRRTSTQNISVNCAKCIRKAQINV